MAFVTAATALASAGLSVYQAVNAKKMMQDAQRAGKEALVRARRTAEVNPYDEMSLPMQSQANAREAALRATAQLTAAAAESERGAARAAGVTDAGLRQLDEQLRAETEVGLFSLQEKQAMQDVANQTRLYNIEQDIAEGAAQAASDAATARGEALTQGVTSLGTAITEFDATRRLYKKGALGRQIERGMEGDALGFAETVAPEVRAGIQGLGADQQSALASQLGMDAAELSRILGDEAGFTKALTGLSSSQQRDLYTQFLNSGKDLRRASFGNLSKDVIANRAARKELNDTISKETKGTAYEGKMSGLSIEALPYFMQQQVMNSLGI